MANAPAHLGQDVLVKTDSIDAQRPAKIVGIPLHLPGGVSNLDEFGNPYAVDVLIFTMSGLVPKYRLRHQSAGATEFWVEVTQ